MRRRFTQTLGTTRSSKRSPKRQRSTRSSSRSPLRRKRRSTRRRRFIATQFLARTTILLTKPLTAPRVTRIISRRFWAGGEVEPDAFENPAEDYEVCFVAGAQVLPADGTKPIEQIRPGDKVLAARRLMPEETPTSTKRKSSACDSPPIKRQSTRRRN